MWWERALRSLWPHQRVLDSSHISISNIYSRLHQTCLLKPGHRIDSDMKWIALLVNHSYSVNILLSAILAKMLQSSCCTGKNTTCTYVHTSSTRVWNCLARSRRDLVSSIPTDNGSQIELSSVSKGELESGSSWQDLRVRWAAEIKSQPYL